MAPALRGSGRETVAFKPYGVLPRPRGSARERRYQQVAFECPAAFLCQLSPGIPPKRRRSGTADGSYEPSHDFLELQGISHETGRRTILEHQACPSCDQRHPHKHKRQGGIVFQIITTPFLRPVPFAALRDRADKEYSFLASSH